MAHAKIIEIENEDGTKKRWRPVSDRIEQFRRDYPAADGYRVVFEKRDSLSYQRGILQLYEVRLKSGHSIEGSGLPALNEACTIIMEATLFDRNGNTVQSGSANGRILEHKDWEKLETAAYQRLLMMLGYIGEIADEDEKGEITKLGGTIGAKAPEPVAETTNSITTVSATETVTEKVTVPPGTSTATVKTLKPNKIPASVLNQIRRLCEKRGIETAPEFKDTNEALRYLADLKSSPATAATDASI